MSPGFNVTVLMAASAVAMKARDGGQSSEREGRARHSALTQHDVDDLRTKAEELLAHDDPFRAPVMTFASMYELERRNPAGLIAIGEDLWRAVQWATNPGPRLPERRDIDG